jgi:hypothetical protein
MFEGKKGGAMVFIYSGVFLVLCIVMFVLFNQITTKYIYEDVTNSTTMFNLSAAERVEVERTMSFWHFAPYILIAIALIYIFVRMIFQQ